MALTQLSHKRALWLLAHPLDRAEADLGAYAMRQVEQDGATLTCVLAVDR